jgi:hypothetical protein
MEVLGAVLLVELVIGVLVALGLRRRHRIVDSQQRDGVFADESIVTIVPLRSVEPMPIRHFRRTCGCKTAGYALDSYSPRSPKEN